jgi:hypothetical protein
LAKKVVALCEIAKIAADELVAKSEDQFSSTEPARLFRSKSAPVAAAMPAAIARLFGRRDPSEVTADLAFCFAIDFVVVHTTQPRSALRLLTTPMWRGYPTAGRFTRARLGERRRGR